MASAWTRQRSQGFGPTSEALDGPYQGYAHFNKGTDFAALAGDTVEARVGGTVIAVGNQGDGWGFSVKVKDANGNTHNYGHLDPSIPVKVGQQIQAGELVGAVGEKIEGEKSTGSHLSYDVWDSSGQFFDALAQDSSGGAAMTQPSSGGGRNYSDPDLDTTYNDLKTAFLNSQKAWISGGRAQSGAQFDAYWETMQDLADFTDQFGHPKSTANDVDPAQQEFENRISLGDYEGRQADRAFSQWFDKYQSAQTNASQDFAQRSQHNADLAANAEARNTSQTPSQLPRNTDRGYIEQSRTELMDMYLKKQGIGEQAPAPGGTGLQTPGQMQPTQQTKPIVDMTGQRTLKPGETMGWQGPIDPNAPNSRAGLQDWEGAAPPYNTLGDLPPDNKPKSSFMDSFADKLFPGNQNNPNQSTPSIARPAMTAISGLDDIWKFGKKTSTGNIAKSAGGKAKKWWQRAFAEGGTNIPGGPGWVGERGPERMRLNGFGEKIVGQNGPEQVMIPDGADIIPMDEEFAFAQIQQAARQGNQPDVAAQQMAAQQRMNDPQLREKVIASLRKGMASNMVQNPPYTPVLENPALQRDRWAANRQITGIPASQEEAAMMQQEAAKGAKRG